MSFGPARVAARHRLAALATGVVAACSAGLIGAAALAAPPPSAAATGPATAATASAAGLRIAPIAYRQRTLANGLVVVSAVSRASPTVSVHLWYRVGSRDDPPGRSGFAHLFEHMMFKSTRYLVAEQFDRLTEDVGGMNNAFTSDDVTGYHEVVPSNHLERMVWAEAERMANLQVDQPNLDSERDVVKEEYRQRVLASPYGAFFNGIEPASYLQHPYRRPGIGNIAELDASRLDDVVAFHRRHYRPDNAVLVVAGDFEPAALDAWVDRYFGAIPRPSAPLSAFTGEEPPWTADRTAVVTGARVPLPAVAITWLAPPVTSADAAALQIAGAVLSSGESSRLNQSLVYRQQVATQAGFNADLRLGPGLLTAYAIVAGDKPADRTAAALLAEVERLASAPPSAAELDKVKTQLVTAALLERQTPDGLASALAEATALQGDPAAADRKLAELQRVTAADVQRVLRRYVTAAHKVTITYRQDGAAAGAAK